jgi:hypothetical protein
MQCDKIPYVTKSDARKAKRSMRKQHKYAKFYRCPVCNMWHLTRSNDKQEKLFQNLELQYMIRSKQAKFLKRISNYKTKWEIILGEKGFIVIYNKKQKLCTVESYFKV